MRSMEETTESLGEALPRELARARMIQGYAKEIGPAGAFMVAMIEQDIRAAEFQSSPEPRPRCNSVKFPAVGGAGEEGGEG